MTDRKAPTAEEIEIELYTLESKIALSGGTFEPLTGAPAATLALVRAVRFLVSERRLTREAVLTQVTAERDEARLDLAAVKDQRDEARKGYEALDKNWHAMHEMSMAAFRGVLNMPEATIPEMCGRVAELRADAADWQKAITHKNPVQVRCTKCMKTRDETRKKYCGDGSDRDDHHDWQPVVDESGTWWECHLYDADGAVLMKGLGRTEDAAMNDAEALYPDGHDRSDFFQRDTPPTEGERTRYWVRFIRDKKEAAVGCGRTAEAAAEQARSDLKAFTGDRLTPLDVTSKTTKVLL